MGGLFCKPLPSPDNKAAIMSGSCASHEDHDKELILYHFELWFLQWSYVNLHYASPFNAGGMYDTYCICFEDCFVDLRNKRLAGVTPMSMCGMLSGVNTPHQNL